jgi:rhodanese-related sulfurtransferase
MQKINLIIILGLLFTIITKVSVSAQTSPGSALAMPALGDPWTGSQLLEPSVLADQIKAGQTKQTLILNIGAVEDIKGATHIGAVSKTENLEKLKSTLAALPKNTAVVIYCGCCPFSKCPNIRPAFNQLKKQGFTNVKLLDLATNLKTNWVAKGYPLSGE